ncbi:hypothetical protein, partial [Escherichia coli]
ANALVIFKFRNRVFSDRSFSNNFIYKAGPNYFETHELRFSANLSARISDAALSLALCSAERRTTGRSLRALRPSLTFGIHHLTIYLYRQ